MNKSIARSDLVADPKTGYLIPDYFGTANWAYSPPLRKFVDRVPGLGPENKNELDQYISVAVPDKTTYPGSDYYEIAVVEFKEQMHSDLPSTKLRGYVQLSTTIVPGAQKVLTHNNIPILKGDGTQAYGVDTPHYMGPAIIATRNVPVRIKFYNLLPTGAGGDLFIPVDTTVMGAGHGPLGMDAMPMHYTQNRANIHLHGNNTVWISDGTPHQWITPAGEDTPYPQGVSVVNVPDMENVDDPRDGEQTLYYTNAQSARLMFYHDHSYGITRLNVYVGESAALLLTDRVEQDLMNGTNETGVNPNLDHILPGLGIPLVIQDKTFVDADTILNTDPTWAWGTTPGTPHTGDLWYPHVYSPAQNPWNPDGTNPFGRWMYGPWFWPPTTDIQHAPVPNPYYDPVNAPERPPMMPAMPYPSMPGEAFMDTPIVNGTAYPFLEVEPKAYRFRILNAADDRFFNLQMYVADPVYVSPDTGYATEVKMVPSCGTPGIPADWHSGVPDQALKGPDWIQIGTEGGFLPAPVRIPSQPITWNLNATNFNFGNVDQHSLLLGTAERADVIVDFSQYAGKTLILYNDAPAAFPAADARYDYYTGNPDQTDEGGAPSTQPGFGPNIRTIMQIRVADSAPAPEYDVAALEAVFAKTETKKGVFEATHDPIILPQADYNSAYNVSNLPSDAASAYVQLQEFSKTFQPIDANGTLLPAVTLPIEPKALQDEMGEVYDTGYGRMSGMLGLEFPASNASNANFVVYPYAGPPVEIVKGTVNLHTTPIGSLKDGTQIWKITHNGVDTHTIHTHLFSAQLINRVAWDGAMIPPDPNELGWKETFRVNPLEHTIIALRPNIPTPDQVPFEVPNSVRLLDPTMPEGAILPPPPPAGEWFDPMAEPVDQVTNHYVNFGWEYVYHCHILAHEEMDMMHAMVFAVPPKAPSNLIANIVGFLFNRRVVLSWMGNSVNETGFTVYRAVNAAGPWTIRAMLPSGSTSYTDPIGLSNNIYYYRVVASNTVGDTATPGFPTMTVDSGFSNVVKVGQVQVLPPLAPTNLTAIPLTGLRVRLTWRDNAINETGFTIERSDNGGAYFTLATVGSRLFTGNVNYTDGTVTLGISYHYRVASVNEAGLSAYSNSVNVNL